jgi:hypothetical protein
MTRNKLLVAVLIPVYKPIPELTEQASIRQVSRILKNHPFVFVCPEGLDMQPYKNLVPTANIIRFKKKFFDGIKGYNKLLLSPFFYRRFKRFNFIFIYQPDAWVFRDELNYWCQQSYDYIGAPWMKVPPAMKDRFNLNFNEKLYHKVGNGGLTLRKVRSHFFATLFFSPLIWFYNLNEDVFFSIIVPFFYRGFSRPDWKKALHFAFELEPRESFEITGKKLPFGCHAWKKYDPEFWADYINEDSI